LTQGGRGIHETDPCKELAKRPVLGGKGGNAGVKERGEKGQNLMERGQENSGISCIGGKGAPRTPR